MQSQLSHLDFTVQYIYNFNNSNETLRCRARVRQIVWMMQEYKVRTHTKQVYGCYKSCSSLSDERNKRTPTPYKGCILINHLNLTSERLMQLNADENKSPKPVRTSPQSELLKDWLLAVLLWILSIF